MTAGLHPRRVDVSPTSSTADPPAWSLVIFDNDGVLVDSEVLANRVLAEVLTGYGHPTTLDESVARYLGGSVARVRELIETGPGPSLPADFERRYEDAVLGRFETELRAVPGVAAALDAVDAPVCVASSGTPRRIETSLTLTGLIGRFAGAVFSVSDVAAGKPAPDLFLHAAEVMGAAPARCAVIEDSPLGVEAAVAAGMTVLGYCALTTPERMAAATARFTSMAELPELLASLVPG